jgi:hypothetical protein
MTGSIESVSSSGDGVENSLSPPSATKKEVPDIENSHETSAGRERKPSRRLCKLYAGLTIVAITALVAVGIALAVAGTRAGRKDITKNAQEYRYAVEQVVGAQVLDDESSPYFQALTWITFNDPMGMSPAFCRDTSPHTYILPQAEKSRGVIATLLKKAMTSHVTIPNSTHTMAMIYDMLQFVGSQSILNAAGKELAVMRSRI